MTLPRKKILNQTLKQALETRRASCILAAVVVCGCLTSDLHGGAMPIATTRSTAESTTLPWREAGLTAREAAAHLLDRLTYGPRPGDIDRLVASGLDTWFMAQLEASIPDDAVAGRLADFASLELSVVETVARYPNPGLVLAQMRRRGTLPEGADAALASNDRSAMRRVFGPFMQAAGYRPQRELIHELFAQKLVRAMYSENQLREILVDFWFNHFNVSITDNEARPYVGPYERDAVRPHVLGSFGDMLVATAKHPAMLVYLDNARSVADKGVRTTFDGERARSRYRGQGRSGGRRRQGDGPRDTALDRDRARRRPSGLNENYARELLELHTLGVEGGFDQADVIAVARSFTGWTLQPPRMMMDESASRKLARARRLPPSAGFVFEDGFIFRADVHDATSKSVLGVRLPAGRGIEDGMAVLELLATHPSTALHLARKLATRFVSDSPPEALIESVAARFLESGGNLKATLHALVVAPEFWSDAARHQKIKSPFELVVSALRALQVEVVRPRGVLEWVARIGQPLYACEAPTGYPDRAEAWVNAGALLARMNFGLALASGQITGTRLDLAALDGGRGSGSPEAESLETESFEDLLAAYVELLLPAWDPGPTLSRLSPSMNNATLAEKLAQETVRAPDLSAWTGFAWGEDEPPSDLRDPSSTLAHVVGVILGSPEFQRR